MRENDINLSVVSKYRGELFGISIVSIIIFHYFNDVEKFRQHDALFWIAKISNYMFGSIGVEVFLFLSGVGLYYSMCNNPDIKTFYIKRLKRVVIPYLFFGMAYWFIRDFVIYPKSFLRYVLDVLLVSFWTSGNKVFWYIAFILVAYMLFPFVFRLMNREINGKDASGVVCYSLCLAVVAFCAVISLLAQGYYENTEIAFARFPIILLGCRYGKKIHDKKPFGIEENLLAALGMMLVMTRMLIQYRVIDIDFNIPRRVTAFFFSVSLIFMLCFLLEKLRSQKFNQAMTTVGSYSLELFMTHVGVRSILLNCGFKLHRIIYFVSYILLSVVLSLILRLLSQKTLKLIK